MSKTHEHDACACNAQQSKDQKKPAESSSTVQKPLYQDAPEKSPVPTGTCKCRKRKQREESSIEAKVETRDMSLVESRRVKSLVEPREFSAREIRKKREKLSMVEAMAAPSGLESSPKRYSVLISKEKIMPKRNVSVLNRAASHLQKAPSGIVAKYMNKGKYFLYGERKSGYKTRTGKPQDFYALRDECVANGTLFEDPEFPASDSSLFSTPRPDRNYEWKRPHEICQNPHFFVEGYSRFDIRQGYLGDCWLLAAIANLTLYHKLFEQVVPDDQDFYEQYAGIWHFRFWKYGKWLDVVIDDRLPTDKGELVFLHSEERNEFWSALLEKAYAKMHGSYEVLIGGFAFEAMEDFTGGLAEVYKMTIDESPPNLFQIMLKAYERASLMGCSIDDDDDDVEDESPEGLVTGHVYSITKVQYVNMRASDGTKKKKPISLLRLRNPWGGKHEWNGPWSDGSPEWKSISESDKANLGLVFENDGEFWMSYIDFSRRFNRVEICNLNPDCFAGDEVKEGKKKKWEVSMYEGEWVKGVTSGGCIAFLDTFWHNPQFRITLTEVDDVEDGDEGAAGCTLVMALMQKHRRKMKIAGADCVWNGIGFCIYNLQDPDSLPKPLDFQFFKGNRTVKPSPPFMKFREVSWRFKLPPGTYCIVPSTYDPDEEGEFLLRVFSEKQNIMTENDKEIGYGKADPKVIKAAPSVEQQQEAQRVFSVFLDMAGEDGELDWEDLKTLLDDNLGKKFAKQGFSKDICRSMIAMADFDMSGRLGLDEFKKLWTTLWSLKKAWQLFDLDNKGKIDGYKFGEAISAAGFDVSNKVMNALMHRYGNKKRQIQFDDFLMTAMKIKTMIDVFKEKEDEETETAAFSLQEWLEKTLYN